MEAQVLKKGTDVLQQYDYKYGKINSTDGTVDITKNNGQLARIESFIGANKQSQQRFEYDSIGRLAQSSEHRGDNGNLTYKQNFGYDRFGNLYRKAASNLTAGQQNPLPFTPIEEDTDIDKNTNKFKTTTGITYNEAGQVITDNKFRNMSFGYDANGRNMKVTRSGVPDALTVYDAQGNRAATKVNDIWQYMVYDAFGKLVAEYGQLSDGLGGVKYIQQDWQGSVRTVTNANGYVAARTDHQAFGSDVGYGIGQRSIEQGYNRDPATRQGYGLTERDDASGLDHTWFRKNENAAGRWTSPDPYKGSMNPGDPQSFNRYSYVQNDPANFVDPSGLQMVICMPDRWDPGTATLYAGACYLVGSGGGNPYGNTTPRDLEPPIRGGGSVSGDTDCEKFANDVESTAANASSATDFVKKLYDANANKDLQKATSGFRSQFTDPGDSPNQVRHTVGAITAGYAGGFAYFAARAGAPVAGVISNAVGGREAALQLTLGAFNAREKSYGPPESEYGPGPLLPPTASQAADMRLNGVAVPIGFSLGNGDIKPGDVANLIRNNICG
jgi:RHS repeat-associated protein